MTIDDFERVRRKIPVLCDLKPSGAHLAVDLHEAGGIPQVMKVLLEASLIDGDCPTITGKTVRETLTYVPALPGCDQSVIRPVSHPVYAQGHLAILKGNLATEGCVAKISGVKHPKITGPARVFDDEASAMAAIVAATRRATSWFCATWAPRAGPACPRCWRLPARSSGGGWANRSLL